MRTPGEKEREGSRHEKKDFAAVMEAAPSDGCLYSTKFRVDLSHSLSLQTKIWWGGGRGTGLSLVLGVGLDCWRE